MMVMKMFWLYFSEAVLKITVPGNSEAAASYVAVLLGLTVF